MTEFKEGKPCKKCGGTKRYLRGRACVSCSVSPHHRAKCAEYYSSNRVRGLLRNAQRRAKKAGVPFDITVEYVHGLLDRYGRVCPALGTPFQSAVGRTLPESMSLDRFDASLGYVEGNVWVLSTKANTIKSSATRTELGRVYRWMCKVMGEQE